MKGPGAGALEGPRASGSQAARQVTQRKHSWVMVGLTGLAFAFRVVGLGFQGLWRDEVDAIRFATRTLSDLFGTFVTPGENGPLYFLLLRPWLELAGQSEFSLRFFSVACGVLAVPLVYRLARRLFPDLPFVPLISATLLTTSPYLVWYGQEGKMYALAVLLVLLSMDRYMAAIHGGGWRRWLAYAAATVAAFYVHLVAALIVPAQVLTYFLVLRAWRLGRRTVWLAALLVLALFAVVYLPLLVWQVPLLLEPGWTGFSFVPLHRMLAALLANYSLGIMQGATWWKLAPFVMLLVAAGAQVTDRERRETSVGVLLCWLLAPVVILFLVSLRRPTFTSRYLIYIVPAFLLVASTGVVAVSRRSRILAALLLISVLALNGWGLVLQARTPFKADFRSATEHVARRLNSTDLLLFQIPYGKYSFEYYYPQFERQPDSHARRGEYRAFLPLVMGGGPRVLRMRDGLFTNAGMNPAEADLQMAHLVGSHRVVWLVETEATLWDERGLVRAWLDENAELTDRAEYLRVTVYRYERTEDTP